MGEVVQKQQSFEAKETKISQKVKDAENQTGEQSAARRAQEALKDADVKSISSWDELHTLMHENGLEYRKKGSGAVIQVGEVTMKASAVSRNLTLNKLEKRFGAYQPPAEGIKPDAAAMEKITSHQPLDPMNNDDRWRAFIAARNEHFKVKSQIREELTITQREEQLARKERQRKERTALYRSLGGRELGRGHINRQSSLLAARHTAETARQKQEHRAQREKLRQVSSTLRSYENWLKSQGLAAEADAWRHRKNDTFLELHIPQGVTEQGKEKPSGILGFRAAATGQGVKFYRDEENQTSFVDMGKRIRVYRQDDDTLLAALQLAQEKWGGVELNGSEEYKRRCAEIAAKNGIRIANPELREMVSTTAETPEDRKRRMTETSKILRQKAMEVARRYIPEGMIIITGPQEGRAYSGPVIGVATHDGWTHVLQKLSGDRVIQHSVTDEERGQLEQAVGRDMTITYRNERIGRIEDSASLRNQRNVGRGR